MASIVQRDKVLSSYNGNIESVMIYDASGAEQIESDNGRFVVLDGLEGIGREVKKALLAEDPTQEVLLVSSPEVNYDGSADLEDFTNSAGDVARAFRLADGDVITLTEDAIEGTPAVGDTYVVGAGGKLTAETAPAEGEESTAKITFVVREDARYELTRNQRAWRFDIVR